MAGIWLFQAVFGNLQTTVFSLRFDHLRLYCIARDANPYVAGKGILAFGANFYSCYSYFAERPTRNRMGIEWCWYKVFLDN